jgi:hypothetical protein
MAVLEADHYRVEIETLMADPIVVALADEVRRADAAAGGPVLRLDSHEVMGRVNEEYRRRGGTESRSIGGVARAVARLVGRDES